jgi:leader peptidase (prepilin peptidase)/N-methyltransferase
MALTVLVRLASGGDALAVLVGGAFGFAIFAAVALVRPGELGGGDVKLATWIGFVFGFPNALWALMVGVFAGGAIAVVLLASHRGDSKSEMPYAPFLCLGALVALLYNPVPWLLYRLAGH